MKDAIVQFVADIPHELATVFLSMIPVAELRFAIPWAILKYDMHPASAFIFSCIGNMLPVPFIILFIRKIFDWLKKFKLLHNLVVKLEERGLSKQETVKKYKFWGLFLFVAIPLPGTGAWTGALIAALMNMRLKDALPSIAFGVFTAGIIVTVLSLLVPSILGF